MSLEFVNNSNSLNAAKIIAPIKMLTFHQPYLYHKLPERQPTCTFIATNTPTQISAFVNLALEGLMQDHHHLSRRSISGFRPLGNSTKMAFTPMRRGPAVQYLLLLLS